MKNDRDERTRPHVPTSPEECGPNSATVQRWQPKRLPLREGIAQASWFCRIMYILIVLGTGALNLIYWQKLPDTLVLRTWFGYSAVEVPTVSYFIVSFLLICYLVYRDLVNRSLSRRKVFIPLIFFLGNYYMIVELLQTMAA